VTGRATFFCAATRAAFKKRLLHLPLSHIPVRALVLFFSSLAESTNDKMLWFSIFSMCCLVFLAVGQVCHLKTFFKKKKLID
jgi:hypothetical protein